ncbi:tRNA pseudouridine(38-40) synthase TruA [Buchnera aphidicola (Ceratoglyphina bambusae)]|uniref:tRNA pseudouridine(38-40) synthase TruA n=1 Tax=Buchnera aphidicola TaxID=9 RepID=UPI0031B84010
MRIALGIEYNGTNYHGWQNQKGIITIQNVLETCLTIVANEKIKIFCAGRTDSKVHSFGQVVHFDTNSVRRTKSWILGTNFYLPKDISVIWAKKVNYKFHARYSAIYRHYRYIINNSNHRSAIFTNNFYNFNRAYLDEKKMNKSAKFLIGEHDFTSFRSKNCQSNVPYRYVFNIEVYRINSLVIFDIIANSFLYNMARNIVGALLEVGCNNREISWINTLLVMKSNNFLYNVVHPSGLYLVYVKYPKFLKFPKINLKKIFNLF